MSKRRARGLAATLTAVLAVAAAVAATSSAVLAAPSAAAPFALRAGTSEPGWISFSLRGAGATPVDVSERVGTVLRHIATLTPAAGSADLARAAPWRCDRRARTFVATAAAAGAGAAPATATATATVATPPCSRRLQFIVAPGHLATGRVVTVTITDRWRRGAIAARVCARRAAGGGDRCRRVRLAPGTAQARLHVRLAQPGRWTIALRSAWRRRIARTVDVSAGARTRILVSGDSMIYGIYEALGGYLKTRGGSVRGDPHAGTGLTRAGFDWIGHSRRLARSARADVAIVFLGTTDGLPFGPAGRPAVECCGPAWTAEYARRVRRIMAAHLRGGRTREYWMLLPPPLSAERVVVFAAINEAVRRAAATFDGEIGLVDIGPIVAPDGVFTREIVYRGKRLVVRVPDGIHLATGGIHIAAALLARTLRRDGLVP